MKIYYIDRKTQIRHFTDLSIIRDKDTLQPVFIILKANSEKEETTQHGKITFSSGSGEYEIDLNVKFTG